MKVVIVGRTRMQQGLCIGGLSETYGPVRIQPSTGYAHPEDAPYQVGDVWDLELTRLNNLQPPHIEDMILSGPGRRLDRLADVGDWLLRGATLWTGPAANAFDGMLRITETGRAHLSADAVPDLSVGFWVPDRPLVRHQSDTRESYWYTDHSGATWRFSYAGVGPSLRIVPAGMIVRVSLARWWTPPDSDAPPVCYAQVSGWFPVSTEEVESASIPQRESLRTW